MCHGVIAIMQWSGGLYSVTFSVTWPHDNSGPVMGLVMAPIMAQCDGQPSPDVTNGPPPLSNDINWHTRAAKNVLKLSQQHRSLFTPFDLNAKFFMLMNEAHFTEDYNFLKYQV